MKKIAVIAAVALSLSGPADTKAEIRLSDVIEVLGNVTESAKPVENALVIAFNLSNSYIIQTFSAENGSFKLPPLPSGIYRIIAVKQGFAPAVATVTPSRQKGRQLALRLESAEEMTTDQRNAIWQARRAIPSDILRELNIVDESFDLAIAEPAPSRFSGEMVSMTGISETGSAVSGFARTALGVQGNLGDGWVVNVSGTLRTIDEEAMLLPMVGEPVAEASGVSMEFRSAADSAYRFDSSRNSWLIESASGDARSADMESHNFEWRRGSGNVSVRYLAHENLFDRSAAFGTERFEVTAGSNLMQGGRSELGVQLRVGQESLTGNPLADPHRTADFSTRGSFAVMPSFGVRYGVNGRLTEWGQEWSPETGFVLRVAPSTSILVRGSYKVEEADRPAIFPSLVFIDEPWRMSPRYEYVVALQSGRSDAARLTASASVAELDSTFRVVFDDRFEEFWDAFYLEPGDVYQVYALGMQKQLGESFAIDVATRAGQASSPNEEDPDKKFLSGSVQSLYIPSGTAVHVAWRFIEQPSVETLLALQESERLNFRVAQSLGLPLGLRILVGVDLARSLNSSVLADGEEMDGYQKRLVGGLSLAF